MLRFLLLATVFVVIATTVVSAVIAFLVAVLVPLALMCAVAIPAYMLIRSKRGRLKVPAQDPLERLQNQYLEGKIDLAEYEKRVGRLLALER
ncbi:MAG: hypothetical protein ACRDFS_05775 [Chloroflexota bacterium]